LDNKLQNTTQKTKDRAPRTPQITRGGGSSDDHNSFA